MYLCNHLWCTYIATCYSQLWHQDKEGKGFNFMNVVMIASLYTVCCMPYAVCRMLLLWFLLLNILLL